MAYFPTYLSILHFTNLLYNLLQCNCNLTFTMPYKSLNNKTFKINRVMIEKTDGCFVSINYNSRILVRNEFASRFNVVEFCVCTVSL